LLLTNLNLSLLGFTSLCEKAFSQPQPEGKQHQCLQYPLLAFL